MVQINGRSASSLLLFLSFLVYWHPYQIGKPASLPLFIVFQALVYLGCQLHQSFTAIFNFQLLILSSVSIYKFFLSLSSLWDSPSNESNSSIYQNFSNLPSYHASFPSNRNSSNLFMLICIKIIICSLHSAFQSEHQVQRGFFLNVVFA